MSQIPQTRLLRGGLDLVTPVLAMRPGTVISAVNFEATEGGYKRCDGYERYDGQPKPSEADYALLPFSGGSVTIAAGTWVTGLTSNAIGLVVLQVITSGTTGAGNAVGNLVLDQIDGTFVSGEPIVPIGRGRTIVGAFSKTSGMGVYQSDADGVAKGVSKSAATAAWDQSAYSDAAMDGTNPTGCFVFVIESTGARAMAFGLNTDPATDHSFASLDYAWHHRTDLQWEIFEGGVSTGVVVAPAVSGSNHASIIYQGTSVRYYLNGVLARTATTTSGRAFYFDSSLYTQNAFFSQINFGLVLANTTSAIVARSTVSAANDATYIAAAIALRRSLILKAGAFYGAGPFKVRGLHVLRGVPYAVAGNATTNPLNYAGLYKSTALGWRGISGDETSGTGLTTTYPVECNFHVYAFSNASAEPDNITPITAFTGEVGYVMAWRLRSGSYAAGTAAGIVVFKGVTGAATMGLGVTASPVFTLAECSVNEAMHPWGKWDGISHAFTGSDGDERMYLVNGGNLGQGDAESDYYFTQVGGPWQNGDQCAFEFDGEVLLPIITGQESYHEFGCPLPKRVVAHREHLMFGFTNGSLQHSAPGEPHNWTAISGASEIGVGSEVTDLISDMAGGVLGVMAKAKIALLYGSSVDDFELKHIADAGCAEWSAGTVAGSVYFDDAGLRQLNTTADFGDFRLNTLSKMVQPFIDDMVKNGKRIVDSVVVRAKAQYRVYFDDKTGLTFSFFGGNRPVEIMPFVLPFQVFCVTSGNDENDREVLFASDEDGWVYQLDVGNSFDGAAITAHIRTAFDTLGGISINKAFARSFINMRPVNTTLPMTVAAEFGYADPDGTADAQTIELERSAAAVGAQQVTYGVDWTEPVNGRVIADIPGFGTNVSLLISTTSAIQEPCVLESYTINFKRRGLVR